MLKRRLAKKKFNNIFGQMQRISIKTAFRTLIKGLSGLGHGESVTFLLVICGERKESVSPKQSILQFNLYILNLLFNYFLLSLIG